MKTRAIIQDMLKPEHPHLDELAGQLVRDHVHDNYDDNNLISDAVDAFLERIQEVLMNEIESDPDYSQKVGHLPPVELKLLREQYLPRLLRNEARDFLSSALGGGMRSHHLAFTLATRRR